MSQAKFRRSLKGCAFAGAIVSLALFGCTNGDTDGGKGNDDAGLGQQVVSDGGFGASLVIRLKDGDEEIGVTERETFFVDARDPSGQPLAFRRVFCESERGLAILEPSANGVAFEHTGPDGSMSGVIGGVAHGSFLLECRLEEGFNLVARVRIKVTGEVPAGFAGFPGAAGGNLGGGVLVENPNEDSFLTSIEFDGIGLNGSPNGPIDINRSFDCNNDGATTTTDIEPFGIDRYVLNIANALNEDLEITEVSFSVDDGRGVDVTQNASSVISEGGSGSLSGIFTEGSQITGQKTFAGSQFNVIAGTYNVTFTIRGEGLSSGDNVTITSSTSVTFGNIDRCGAS